MSTKIHAEETKVPENTRDHVATIPKSGLRPAKGLSRGKPHRGKQPWETPNPRTKGELLTTVDFSERIESNWHRQLDSILETAKVCLEADEALTPEEKKALLKSISFTESTLSKLVGIGKCRWFDDPAVRIKLPVRYTVLYGLSLLTDDQRKSGLENGIINPRMKRSDIQRLKVRAEANVVEDIQDTAPTAPTKSPYPIFLTVRLTDQTSMSKLMKLEQDAPGIELEYGVKLEHTMGTLQEIEDEHGRRMGQAYEQQVCSPLRKLGRKAVRDHKANFKSRHRKWSFSSDETMIQDDAEPDDVKSVFEVMGRIDEYEKAKLQLESELSMPAFPLELADEEPTQSHPPPVSMMKPMKFPTEEEQKDIKF